MDFNLTEAQKELQKKTREFAIKEILPVAASYDEHGKFPIEIIEKAYKAGLVNLAIPKKYGGPGYGLLESVVVVEEIAAACPGFATSIFANNLGAEPIILGGNEEQKDRILRELVKKFSLISFATSEPGMGSDVAGIKCRAQKDGEDYILNGTKYWITNAGYAKYISLFATVDPAKKHKGICAFIVPTDLEGVKTGNPIPKLGHRASNTTSVVLKNVRIPKENVLAPPGRGFVLAMQTFAHTRPTIGAFACGMARGAMEYAIAYAKRRRAFENEIGNFQAIQFMIAEVKANIDAAQLLTWKAAWEADQGKDNVISASIAKVFSSDHGMETVTNALQIFGGYGYTTNFLIEKLLWLSHS